MAAPEVSLPAMNSSPVPEQSPLQAVSDASLGGAVPRGRLSLRHGAVRVLFRWLLASHAAILWLVRRLPWRKRAHSARPLSVLLTGTFFSENWIMNHLRPLVMSESCACATVVSLFPIPKTPKVQWITPPRWLCRVLGETPARLLIVVLTALRQRPDVIGGFHLIPNGLLAAVLAPLICARSLHFCGGGPREVLGGGILGNRALEGVNVADLVAEKRLIAAMSGIDRIVCMGERTVRFYRDRGVNAEFAVIPGGIDASRFGVENVEKVYDLIFVGRLVAVKRVDLFLDAVALLVKQTPDLRAVIVGTGELESELRALALQLGVAGNVTFAGQQADVAAWLRQSRAFVLTSDSEGLSLAMMEALTCGLPCVVSDVGELGEVVQDGLNGFLVTERTGAAFARVLGPLLSNPTALVPLSAGATASGCSFELSETVKKWDLIFAEFATALRLHASEQPSETLAA
jgi:glycosyltransferase involved in cell wall biosynthesis